jgi:hypothetical protein
MVGLFLIFRQNRDRGFYEERYTRRAGETGIGA